MAQTQQKIVVIGGVAGGASAAARIRRLDESAEIVIFERGECVSYSNCCLPYYLSGTVQESDDLIMMTPEDFRQRFDIDVRVRSEVTAIDRAAKTVTVCDAASGKTYHQAYDKLILSPGARPIVPRGIAGTDRPNVFTVRNVSDVHRLRAYLDGTGARRVVVAGGGFIGIEVAENLRLSGREVTLVEMAVQILQPFDFDMVQMLQRELDENGVALWLHTQLAEIADGYVIVRKNGAEQALPADAVVLALGVAPETALARDAGLTPGQHGGIRVNKNYQTSDPDIYAVGDAAEVFLPQLHSEGRLALAGPAQLAARAAADHICGRQNDNPGFIPAFCLRVFGQNAAAVGLTEAGARQAGYACDSVTVFPPDHVGIMPGSSYLAVKLVFEVPTGALLGAQAIGAGDAVGRMNVIAALLRMHGKVSDLKNLNLCYSPVYSTAKDPVNQAALVAQNILDGTLRQVHVDEVRGLVESGAYILDVREAGEFAAGHLNGAHNIPLSRLRERIDEIPREIPVYVHCRSGQRSYYALCCLQGHGFRNVVNISGSYLGVSLYEAFTDKAELRTPILDRYNFD